MKKILMTAAIALTCFGVQAQENRTHNISFSLDLSDVIVMPLSSSALGTTAFTSELAFDGSNAPIGSSTFTVSSNRMFNVTSQLTTLAWTGANGHNYNSTFDVNTNMLSSVIGWTCDATGLITPVPPMDVPTQAIVYPNPTAMTGTPKPYVAYSTDENIINNAPWGAAQPFTMTWYATPGWDYTGGLYTGNISVTATQE